MAGNTPTPSGETTTTPSAPVVPAVAAPAVTPATPVTPPVATATPATPAPVTETPPATPPVAAKTNEPAPAAPPVVPAASAVPEKYEFALDGGLKINQAAIDAVTPALKEAGMSQAAATKLVSDFVKYQTGLPAAKNAADLETLRSDPEIGQLNFGRTQATVNEALAAFTTPEMRDRLSAKGMVNDPDLVRFFLKVGRAMADAGETPRGAPEIAQKTTAQKLYGKTSAAT